MRRREFIALLGGASVAWPLAAQQPAMRPIGLLSARAPGSSEMAALRQGLAENGYVESEPEIEAAFATVVNQRDSALLVTNDPLFISRLDQLVALAARHAVPTIYDRRAYTVARGLLSYGTDYLDGYRKLGVYAAKILNGAKPADLPVEQSTKFELVINLRTAKELGLEVPATLLARADEVIE
jgi:putative ABC transport system substrate-binding protein